jgi:hypothetical protein
MFCVHTVESVATHNLSRYEKLRTGFARLVSTEWTGLTRAERFVRHEKRGRLILWACFWVEGQCYPGTHFPLSKANHNNQIESFAPLMGYFLLSDCLQKLISMFESSLDSRPT